MKRNGKRKPVRQGLRICMRNEGYAASLELHKVYVVLEDRAAAKIGLVRVIDESGEDYLYPRGFFSTVRLEPEKKAELIAA